MDKIVQYIIDKDILREKDLPVVREQLGSGADDHLIDLVYDSLRWHHRKQALAGSLGITLLMSYDKLVSCGFWVHGQGMPDNVKKRLAPLAEGVLLNDAL